MNVDKKSITLDEAMHEHHEECCAHHHHHHHHHHSKTMLVLPVVSLVMLVSGLVFQHVEMEWIEHPVYGLVWFLIAFLPVGFPVMKEAWEGCMEKDFFNEFSLMVLASIGAFAIGEYPEAVAVMLFYTIGEMLQHGAVDKASRNIEALLDVRPEKAAVLRNHHYSMVSPESVSIGETIEVRPGERVPLDGYLDEELAAFDTSALTGESVPKNIEKGEEVLAGMIVCDQIIHLKVSKLYADSALSRILDLVKEASERKAPSERFITRFARIYTPVVILLAFLITVVPALVALFVPSFSYVFAEWLYRGLVFLVISCPCALVISVPLGYFAGIGTASRMGILFKGGNYLDALSHIEEIAFDKTGTLTKGEFDVIRTEVSCSDREKFLQMVLSLEEKSTHPIAQAIVRSLKRQGVAASAVTSMKEIPGQGVEALIDGRMLFIGNVRAMETRRVAVPEILRESVDTTVVCALDGEFAGGFILADVLKDDAADAVADLHRLGIHDLTLLSGDKKEIVRKYAEELKIEKAFGEMLPQDKAAYVEKEVGKKKIAFVGDGMNDAPVLTLSTVGIAMGGLGSDAAIESADVVIQNDRPSSVGTAIRIGRFTNRIVRQNIVGAITLKVIILIAAMLGYASLWGAVFADVGTALLAVFNSMRILYRKMD